MIKDQDIAIEKYREFRESFPKGFNTSLIVYRVKTWHYGSQEKNKTISLSLDELFEIFDNAMGIQE